MTDLLSQPPKHHYIPVLYLKQWTVNGRFTEFSRPLGRDRVEHRGTSPKGTGFQRGLYRMTSAGLPEDVAEAVERKFMGQVDNLAKEALDILLGTLPQKWPVKQRSAWSRFVNGLMFRVPERVAATRKYLEEFWQIDYERHKAEYEKERAPGDPDFPGYLKMSIERESLIYAMKQIDDQQIGSLLNRMEWRTIDVSGAGRPLFTSDRPIIHTNGMAYPDSYLMMPINPTRLFIATNHPMTARQFTETPPHKLVKGCNRHVIRRAQKYAWNIDETEVEFVRKHLSAEAAMDHKMWGTAYERALQEKRQASKA
jgi:hypothetical protein